MHKFPPQPSAVFSHNDCFGQVTDIEMHPHLQPYMNTRISGRYAPFILGLPAGFSRAHARAHFVRFSCRARRGYCCSLPLNSRPKHNTYVIIFVSMKFGIQTCGGGDVLLNKQTNELVLGTYIRTNKGTLKGDVHTNE